MVSSKLPTAALFSQMACDNPALEGHALREDVTDSKGGEVLIKAGERITIKMLKTIAKSKRDVAIVPYVSDEYVYLSADAEDKYVIAQANAALNEFREYESSRKSLAVTILVLDLLHLRTWITWMSLLIRWSVLARP